MSQNLIYPKQSCWTDADMGKEFGFQINCLESWKVLQAFSYPVISFSAEWQKY